MHYIDKEWQVCKRTCSVDALKDGALTFATKQIFMDKIADSGVDVFVLLKDGLKPRGLKRGLFCIDPAKTFIEMHNYINAKISRKVDIVANPEFLHPSVVFDKSQKIVVSEDKLLEMKHMGNVVLEKDITIGAYSVIHYASIDSTIIREGTKIGSFCNIGHNSIIGKHNILTSGTNIGGSVTIGDHCFFGLNSVVRPHVTIKDSVYVGMGSIVVNDLLQEGMYYGSPARYVRQWDGKTF